MWLRLMDFILEQVILSIVVGKLSGQSLPANHLPRAFTPREWKAIVTLYQVLLYMLLCQTKKQVSHCTLMFRFLSLFLVYKLPLLILRNNLFIQIMYQPVQNFILIFLASRTDTIICFSKLRQKGKMKWLLTGFGKKWTPV